MILIHKQLKTTINKLPTHKGYTLIEMVLYGALLAAIAIFVVSSILQLGGSYAKTRALRRLNEVGDVAMERIVREARLAKVISTAQQNTLIVQRDISDTLVNYKFALTNERLTLAIDGGASDFITPNTVTVTKFTTSRLCAPADCPAEPELLSEGVRIEMNLITGSGKAIASTTYTGFAVLRDSYAN